MRFSALIVAALMASNRSDAANSANLFDDRGGARRGLKTSKKSKSTKKTKSTVSPTASPTGSPTKSPTASPTGSPTKSPTASPTGSPTMRPTAGPTTLCDSVISFFHCVVPDLGLECGEYREELEDGNENVVCSEAQEIEITSDIATGDTPWQLYEWKLEVGSDVTLEYDGDFVGIGPSNERVFQRTIIANTCAMDDFEVSAWAFLYLPPAQGQFTSEGCEIESFPETIPGSYVSVVDNAPVR